jgi:hypothetical protein
LPSVHEKTLVVDAGQAILDGHVAEHEVIFGVVLVLVTELEGDHAQGQLVALVQLQGRGDRLAVDEGAVGAAQVGYVNAFHAIDDHGVTAADAGVGDHKIHIVAAPEHGDVIDQLVDLAQVVALDHHQARPLDLVYPDIGLTRSAELRIVGHGRHCRSAT